MAEQGNNVQWRLSALERRVDQMEERSELLTTLRIELREVKKEVHDLVESNRQRDDRDRAQSAQAAQDKKADRRWQLTVMAAWASAIIAAIAIIVPLLVG